MKIPPVGPPSYSDPSSLTPDEKRFIDDTGQNFYTHYIDWTNNRYTADSCAAFRKFLLDNIYHFQDVLDILSKKGIITSDARTKLQADFDDLINPTFGLNLIVRYSQAAEAGDDFAKEQVQRGAAKCDAEINDIGITLGWWKAMPT